MSKLFFDDKYDGIFRLDIVKYPELQKEFETMFTKNWLYVFLLWGTNIVFSLVLTIPIWAVLQDNLSHSLWSSKLALKLDYFWLLQFQHSNKNLLDKLPILLFSIVGLNVLIQNLYQGGLLAVFNSPNILFYSLL